MEEFIASIVTGIATKYLSKYSEEAVTKFFNWAIEKKPQIKELLRRAKTPQDVENIFKEAIGVFDANAGSGTIEIDQAIISAIRGARFNHANGKVTIDKSTISAPRLRTGGEKGAKGQTTIKDSDLRSRGTRIKGKNYRIKITGDAHIDQN